jgi:tetratricopeptide (TPR) repeat protein
MGFDRVYGAWDTFRFGETMTLRPVVRNLALAGLLAGLGVSAFAQALAVPGHDEKTAMKPAQGKPEPGKADGVKTDVAGRADAYYYFTMGHIFEQQYEATSRAEFATQSIEAYKKAYALDPKSPVIGERLAEMYWKAQRIHDAVEEANAVLKRDPNDLAPRRLLGRIYLRSLGDFSAGSGNSDAVIKAIEQYREIYRVEPDDTESALWLARLYRLRNEPDKAEEVLRGILKADGENEAAVEQLTQLLLDAGKNGEAIMLLENITARQSSPSLLDLLGDAYTQGHDLAKAESAYRKAMDLDPAELSHQRGLGQTLLAEDKYPEALTVYQKLSDAAPDDADVYLRIAQIYRELHQMDRAEDNLVKARQYAPGSLEVMYNEAMLYQAQGRFDDAIRVLSDAVTGIKGQSTMLPTRRRSLAILYQQLGQLYRDTQNYQAAVFTYDELGHLGEEEDRRARLLIMDTYRQAKELPRALTVGKDAVAQYPKDQAIRSNYALLQGENGQTDDAVKTLRAQLTGTAATDRETYVNIAQVYERARKYKEAEEAAKAAEALPGKQSDNEMVWFFLGAIYEKQKMYDRAEVEFKKVLEMNPNSAETLNYYGYMLGDQGIRLDDAQDLVKRALKIDPYNGAYLDSLGWIYFKQNKMVDAEATLKLAEARESHDATIHSHLGDVYAKSGKGDKAAAEYEKSLAEWHRALPADVENDKIAEIEKKLSQSKHRVAQQTGAPDGTPNEKP